jgi:6-phosphogluconolactonase
VPRDDLDPMVNGGRSAQFHIGTYSGSGGAGLYPLRHRSDGWSLGEAYPAALNASYGVYSGRHELHYLLDEGPNGAVGVFRRDAVGWRALARVSTHGAEPCYIALDPDEDSLAVANYGSGSVALFQLDARTGLPGDPPELRENAGRGPVADRQEGPHAHCAVFATDRKWLYQTDLGTDEILAFALDADGRRLGERQLAFQAPAGSGPRHLVFHPHKPRAFLVSELASTLTVFGVGEGVLTARQSVSTLPPDFDGDSLGGHLAINAAGDRVYVTNRGHDSIATFALDGSGDVSLLGHVPSGGASPRFLLLDAQGRMLVANEEGNNVTIFNIATGGTPIQSDEVAVPAPAFVFTTQSSEAKG